MAGKVEAEDEEFLGTAPSNKKDTMSEDLEMHKMTDRDILGGEEAKEGMTKDHKSVRQKKSETQFSAISTRLKVLLAFGALALFLNFGLTGACFYLVRQLKIEIANSRDQGEIGGTSSNQTSNNGVQRTTEPQLIEGPPGMKGETGAPGPKGKKGSVGSHGVPGLNGPKGKQGLKGEKGNPGPYGQKGVKGELGLQGIKGEMGEKGLAGLPGRDGRDGRNGTYGSKGLMGDKGQKGGIGPTGSRGVNGQKGEPGRSWKGAKGEPGTSHQGPIGPKGNKGEVGTEGLKGDIGNVGNTGEKGDKGQKGDSDVATLQQRIQELQRVRLVDGGGYYGRVEVFHNGVWGTVCDDGWDTNDAAVFCRMMGFKGANLAPASANYGQGSDQIWLDDVNCDGSEINLDDCSKSSWGSHNCGHSEDAGASCIR